MVVPVSVRGSAAARSRFPPPFGMPYAHSNDLVSLRVSQMSDALNGRTNSFKHDPFGLLRRPVVRQNSVRQRFQQDTGLPSTGEMR